MSATYSPALPLTCWRSNVLPAGSRKSANVLYSLVMRLVVVRARSSAHLNPGANIDPTSRR